MTKETLREQNERLHKELEEARVQIQQLQREVSKLNDATNAAYEKSSCYKADQACIKDLLSQLKIFKNQLMISRQEKRKVDERIRSLNNLESPTHTSKLLITLTHQITFLILSPLLFCFLRNMEYA